MTTFVIAEAGINHCGDIVKALDMVDIAAECGADAVKFQCFDAHSLGYTDDKMVSLLKNCEFSPTEWSRVRMRCLERGIEFMATAFSPGWLETLINWGIKRIKIGSGQATFEPILSIARKSGLPVIISDGMTEYGKFTEVLDELEDVTPLYCVSKYPAPLSEVDFNRMMDYETYGTYGYSDHTQGIEACILAAAMGADVVEKHFTIHRGLPGPDQVCSAEPNELRRMIAGIRAVPEAPFAPYPGPQE